MGCECVYGSIANGHNDEHGSARTSHLDRSEPLNERGSTLLDYVIGLGRHRRSHLRG